ncbi:MAG: UpxY family transcription antiterminator [Silvibacterium sp.]|nr:UpxY family transcription antiterminator [Silvibacterium sp.]
MLGLTERELYPELPISGDCLSAQDLRPWFALTVKPQHEFTVQQGLAAKGLEAYAPAYWTARRWSDRVKKLQQALFPGYVFCHFSATSRTPVLRTPGVRSIVSFGAEPAPIPAAQLASIQQMLASNYPVEPWPFLQVGQLVRIGEGSLTGLEGILVHCRNANRVVVSIELLQRSVAVEVDSASLIPLN